MSTSSTPALCEASRTKGTECSRQSAAMAYTGSTKPNTFETWVHTTHFAPGMAFRKPSIAALTSNSGVRTTSSSAPSMVSGRVTALCSQPETTTRSPGDTSEERAMFRPCVAFMVNTTFSGEGALKSSASAARHSYAFSAASMAGRCPPLPGLAMVLIAATIASATARGFWSVVAALSRYIIAPPPRICRPARRGKACRRPRWHG